MTTNKLSLTTAAQELGLSRRTITAYSSGVALIPKHIGLACKGWEYQHKAA
jgi:predicted transcriptional regulator